KNAVDVAGGAAVLVEEIRTVGDETAGSGEVTGGVDRRQAMLGRERYDHAAMDRRPGAAEHDQAAAGRLRERREGAVDFAGIAHVDGTQLHAERRRERLDSAELAGTGRDAGVAENRHARHARRDLLEQLQPFAADGIIRRR